jgi:histidine triad (HIT) family protein
MKDCVFCQIIDGRIPHYGVYEDSHTMAFLDIHPLAKGHTVVIPRVHAETVQDLDEELMGHVMRAVNATMQRVNTVLSPDGYTVGWNHGEAGGQVVPHLHIHVIPRWSGDGGGNIHSVISSQSDMSVEELARVFAQ